MRNLREIVYCWDLVLFSSNSIYNHAFLGFLFKDSCIVMAFVCFVHILFFTLGWVPANYL